MKTNQEASPLPALSLPRLSSKLENLADNLGRFALEFGVVFNDSFGPRVATIGFANAVVLHHHEPGNAARLEELLAAESVPPPEELAGATGEFVAALAGERDWTHEVGTFLRTKWRQSADDTPGIAYALEARLRILHGIRIGLTVARESPETAAKIREHIGTLWVENRFLSTLLYRWSDHDWEPHSRPFVEFMGSYYEPGSVEQRVLGGSVAAILPAAKLLTHPWSLSFWVAAGWNGGRKFVESEPETLRALLAEAPKDTLQGCHRLYQKYVVGGADPDGEVRIERATLRFIGELAEPDLARCHCTGREPRRLARVAYDFAFWMGIFSAHSIPDLET